MPMEVGEPERWECRSCRRTLRITYHTGEPRPLLRRCLGCGCRMTRPLKATPEQEAARATAFAELMAMAGLPVEG